MRRTPATEGEVKAALEKANQYGVRLRSVGTIAGLVAEQRGLKTSWPSAEEIRQYVSISSVKKVLDTLAAKGECFPVPGNHWALGRGVTPKYTYYLTPAGRQEAIEQRAQWARQRRQAAAQQYAVDTLVERHAEIIAELRAQYLASHPEVNWEERW